MTVNAVRRPAVRALVVEDEAAIRRVIVGYLRAEGYTVTEAADGLVAVDAARRDDPDVVVLDLMLPGIDGIEVCQNLRTFTDAYIVMLTARTDEVDTLIGLSVGADDYITKPFSPRVLVARIKPLLRRPRPSGIAPGDTRRLGSLPFDTATRTVLVDDQPVDLTRTEFNLLDALTERPGQVLSRHQLIDHVWGPDWIGDARLVDAHISYLHNKLGDDVTAPRFIETIRGVGFRTGPG